MTVHSVDSGTGPDHSPLDASFGSPLHYSGEGRLGYRNSIRLATCIRLNFLLATHAEPLYASNA